MQDQQTDIDARLSALEEEVTRLRLYILRPHTMPERKEEFRVFKEAIAHAKEQAKARGLC